MARRSLLKGGLAALAVAPLLQSCGDPGLAFSGVERIPAPDDPVRWDLSDKHAIIESGLTPEAGSTLRIYNYADYLSPRVLKNFEKKYDIDIRLSTFNDADEALTKIASGNLEFDLYFPSYDSLGRLVTADLLRPLNQDYMSNSGNLWSGFRDPWYDLGGLYTRPYTIYSTGIGWRTDRVPEEIGRATTPTTSSGTPSTPATSRSSTTGTPRSAWCCSATASTSTAPTRVTWRWCASSCSISARPCTRR